MDKSLLGNLSEECRISAVKPRQVSCQALVDAQRHRHDLHQLVRRVAGDQLAAPLGRTQIRHHDGIAIDLLSLLGSWRGGCRWLLLLFLSYLPLRFVKDPARLEPAGKTLFEPAPLAAAPTFRVNFAIFGGAGKLLKDIVFDWPPEERLAAVACLATVVHVLSGVASTYQTGQLTMACFRLGSQLIRIRFSRFHFLEAERVQVVDHLRRLCVHLELIGLLVQGLVVKSGGNFLDFFGRSSFGENFGKKLSCQVAIIDVIGLKNKVKLKVKPEANVRSTLFY